MSCAIVNPVPLARWGDFSLCFSCLPSSAERLFCGGKSSGQAKDFSGCLIISLRVVDFRCRAMLTARSFRLRHRPWRFSAHVSINVGMSELSFPYRFHGSLVDDLCNLCGIDRYVGIFLDIVLHQSIQVFRIVFSRISSHASRFASPSLR